MQKTRYNLNLRDINIFLLSKKVNKISPSHHCYLGDSLAQAVTVRRTYVISSIRAVPFDQGYRLPPMHPARSLANKATAPTIHHSPTQIAGKLRAPADPSVDCGARSHCQINHRRTPLQLWR
jgi:hypothetical protein